MRNLALSIVALVVVGCTTGSSGPAGDDDSSVTLDCATYCGRAMANCTGVNAQFDTSANCMASCLHYPMGTIADMAGNTLGCRIYHAGAAMADPVTHCVHAGPSGGGVCGAACDGFCALVTAECPTQYPDANTCATQCAAYATAPDYTSNVTSGNTLSCRIYHATAASTDPGTHCPHTAMTSATCL